MDNSLLLINTKNIRDLAFLDDDCDAPVDMDWDYEVSSGEIPGIFYDMFPDYAGVKEIGGTPQNRNLNEQLIAYMDRVVAKHHIDVETFSHQLAQVTAMFEDGTVRSYDLDTAEGTDDLAFPVTNIYEAGKPLDGPYIVFRDSQEMEVVINLRNVSMLKLPLAATEEAIAQAQAEFMVEIEQDDRQST